MTDLLDPLTPEAIAFVRAGAERVVEGMGNSARARAAMIYSHLMALSTLIDEIGDGGSVLSQKTVEVFLLELPEAYRSAFMLDTLSHVEVSGYNTEATRNEALARTERGQMSKVVRYEYQVTTVALVDAQTVANGLGKAGWRQSGQSMIAYPPRPRGEWTAPLPPAVVLTFERVLDEETNAIRTTPAVQSHDTKHQQASDGGAAAQEVSAGDGRGDRGHLPVLG